MEGEKSLRAADVGVTAGSWLWLGEYCCTVVVSLILLAAAFPSGVGGKSTDTPWMAAVSLCASIELL